MTEDFTSQNQSATSTGTPIFDRLKTMPPDPPVSPIAEKAKRTKRAEKYEERVNGVLREAMKGLVTSPNTVSDAAAIITYGPTIASKAGDLADQDPRVARAIDFITSGTENPYLALAFASLPLLAQVVRNHETPEDTSMRVSWRIPFTKKTLSFPWKIKLKNPFLRGITKEPDAFSYTVFGNPAVRQALAEQGVEVAWKE